MTYKEFGGTIAPANTTSTGFPIAMSSHLGGGRTIDNITNINNWQLLGDGDTSAEQKNNAVGQVWYDIHVSKYYKLDSWNVDTPIWVEFTAVPTAHNHDDIYLKLIGGNITGNLGIGSTNPVSKLQIGNDFTVGPDTGNVIFLSGSGFTSMNATPQQLITSNSSALTPGIIGLDLHNDNNTAGAYAPLLIFSKKESDSTPYNSSIAGIGARTVSGSGVGGGLIDGELMFYTSPSSGGGLLERMRISENGNVGIGVIPTEKLEVSGTAKVQDIKVEDSVRFIDTTVEKAGMRYNTTNSTIEFYFN